MDSYKTYDAPNDRLSIHFNYERNELIQGTAIIYYNAVDRAAKLLSKYIVRRFLNTHNIDEIISRIDVNKIVAESLRIHATFGEKP